MSTKTTEEVQNELQEVLEENADLMEGRRTPLETQWETSISDFFRWYNAQDRHTQVTRVIFKNTGRGDITALNALVMFHTPDNRAWIETLFKRRKANLT